jgi:hypothetical protein
MVLPVPSRFLITLIRKEDIGVLLAALFWIHPSHTRVIHMHPIFLA